MANIEQSDYALPILNGPFKGNALRCRYPNTALTYGDLSIAYKKVNTKILDSRVYGWVTSDTLAPMYEDMLLEYAKKHLISNPIKK